MIETMVKFQTDPLAKLYAHSSLKPWYHAEAQALSSLGISLDFDPFPIFIDSMIRKHGHQCCWSEKLMVEVLTKIGFSDVRKSSLGESHFDKSTAIERRVRGIDLATSYQNSGIIYDPESGVVEAKKPS
jgi:hypothetical protein